MAAVEFFLLVLLLVILAIVRHCAREFFFTADRAAFDRAAIRSAFFLVPYTASHGMLYILIRLDYYQTTVERHWSLAAMRAETSQVTGRQDSESSGANVMVESFQLGQQ